MSDLPTDPDALLTYDQVAKLLGVGIDTVRGMVATGDWPAPTLYGRQLRWRAAAVREFMAAQQLIQNTKRGATQRDDTLKEPNSGLVEPNSDESGRNEPKGGRRKPPAE